MNRRAILYVLAGMGVSLIWFSIALGRMTGQHIFHASFLIGLLLFIEVVLALINKHPLLGNWGHEWKKIVLIMLLGIFVGVLFDIFGIFLLKFWEYPDMAAFTYTVLVLPAWALTFFIIYESYRLLRIGMDRTHLDFGLHHQLRHISGYTFALLGLAGVFLLTGSVALAVTNTQRTFTPTLVALGMWLILENIEYQKTHRTLIVDILSGQLKPLFTIIAGALLFGIAWEFMNLPMQTWIYYHLPWPSFAIAGIPVSLLLSWPWLYIIFLSLWRIVYRGDPNLWR